MSPEIHNNWCHNIYSDTVWVPDVKNESVLWVARGCYRCYHIWKQEQTMTSNCTFLICFPFRDFRERERKEKKGWQAILYISNMLTSSSFINTITRLIKRANNQWISDPLIISVIIKHLHDPLQENEEAEKRKTEIKTGKMRQAIRHL